MSKQSKPAAGPGSPERSGGEPGEAPRSGGEPGPAALQPVSNEVEARPRRRSFPNDFKLRIVREADACRGLGDVGLLLRREGLYSSHLAMWRRLRDQGALSGAAPRKRGPPSPPVNPLRGENERLLRKISTLEAELAQSRALIELQKKVASLFTSMTSHVATPPPAPRSPRAGTRS